jgi:MinD superfamily P-loop ATPase
MIISVARGKGGTGKTLVATSLACSLKDKNKVQLLDCDVEEPNAHLLLNPTITGSEPVNMQVPIVDRGKCTFCGKCAEVCAYKAIAVLGERVLTFHELCHSCGACSYLCPEKAIYEIGRPIGTLEYGAADNIDFIHGRLNIGEAMATPVIKKVQEKANNQNIVIVDVPPGTSCPVVESIKDTDFCLLVTEPTPFGLNDLMLAVETVRMLQLPCGVIINRAGLGDEHIEKYCLGENIPVLLHIPLDSKIAGFYSRGLTLAQSMPEWKDRFVAVFNRIKEIVGERAYCAKR